MLAACNTRDVITAYKTFAGTPPEEVQFLRHNGNIKTAFK